MVQTKGPLVVLPPWSEGSTVQAEKHLFSLCREPVLKHSKVTPCRS